MAAFFVPPHPEDKKQGHFGLVFHVWITRVRKTRPKWPYSTDALPSGPRLAFWKRSPQYSGISATWAVSPCYPPRISHPIIIEGDPSPIEQTQPNQTMPTMRSSAPTTRSGLQRSASPPPKRKRSNAAEQMRKRNKNEADDENVEEEVLERKGKGGRDRKRAKEAKKKSKRVRFVPKTPCPCQL